MVPILQLMLQETEIQKDVVAMGRTRHIFLVGVYGICKVIDMDIRFRQLNPHACRTYLVGASRASEVLCFVLSSIFCHA